MWLWLKNYWGLVQVHKNKVKITHGITTTANSFTPTVFKLLDYRTIADSYICTKPCHRKISDQFSRYPAITYANYQQPADPTSREQG